MTLKPSSSFFVQLSGTGISSKTRANSWNQFAERFSDDARRPFTVPEIRKVIEVADKEWKSLILFGLYTDQRLADLATLRWDNIDLPRNEIRIKTRKTGKRLAIPVAPALKTHIKSLAAAREGYLHPKAAATVTSQKRSGTLSNQFADLLAQAGLRDKAPHRSKGKGRDAKRSSNGLSFHALRHTAVSLLKDAGVPEAVVMELVGHDSEAMSVHYTHVGTEALAKAVAALPEI